MAALGRSGDRAGVLLAAVEGGGTSTTLLLADASEPGRVHRASGGTTNPFLAEGAAAATDRRSAALSFPSVASTIVALLRNALEQIDRSSPPSPSASRNEPRVRAMVLAISGFGAPADAAALERDLCALGAAQQCRVTGDAEAPARCIRASGRFPRGDTIVLICGTGSAAFVYPGESDADRAAPGVAPLRARARAGGRGHILGDQGSAFWIGREALSRALVAHDEGAHSPGTEWLAEQALAHFELKRFEDIVGVAQDPARGKTLVAGFARIVARGAAALPAGSARQTYCAGIMEQAGAWMGRLLVSAVRSRRRGDIGAAGPREYHVVLVGSVWASWDHLGPALARTVRNACRPSAIARLSFVRMDETCALGALHDAAILAGAQGESAAAAIAARIAASLRVVCDLS